MNFEADRKVPLAEGQNYQPVGDAVLNVLESLDRSFCPAYIIAHRWNIVTWNKGTEMVFGGLGDMEEEERNVVYMMFCNENYMRLFDDWSYHARGVIARFHATMAKHVEDIWFDEFVQKIKDKNADFALWWSQYDVHGMTDIVKQLCHPKIGEITFEFVSLDISDNPNLKILIHNPDEVTRKNWWS